MGSEDEKFTDYQLLQIEKTSEVTAAKIVDKVVDSLSNKVVCIPHCESRHQKLKIDSVYTKVAMALIGIVALYAAGINSAPIIRAVIGLLI